MKNSSLLTRREFLGRSAIGAALTLGGVSCASAASTRRGRRIAPDRKLNVACIGLGGKGAGDVAEIATENIVALCDVDLVLGAGTIRRHPQAKVYRDYRRMLREMDEQIDAVTISTPDHMHYPIAMMAIRMGKHVFVQKPMAHNLAEVEALRLAADRHGVVTQMGTQGHYHEAAARLVEVIRGGLLGPIREIHCWTDRPVWPQGIDRPVNTPPVPPALDWNLWLGIAPERPYHPVYAPGGWRGWWDFGCGSLGDMGCHGFDVAMWALNPGAPEWIEARTSPLHKETAPAWSVVTYQFPARDGRPPFKIVWYDGGQKPPRPADLEPDRDLPDGLGGQLYIGDKATVMSYGSNCQSWRIIPEIRMKELMPHAPPRTIERRPGLMPDFIQACKGGPAPAVDFSFAAPLTETVLLGNLAIRSGHRITWDAAKRCTHDPAADAFLSRSYRSF